MHQRKDVLAIVAVLAISFSSAQLTAQAKAGKAPQTVPPVNFAAPVNYTTGTLPFANAVGDFNGDHILDVAVCNYSSNNVSVLLGNGDGTFQTAVNYPVGTEPSAITVADLNNDGFPDIAVADEIGKTIAVLINNADGTGTFKAAVLYPAGQAPRGITAGSLRNNGILDLVVANNLGGNVTVFLGNGDGTFQAGVNYPADVNPKSVALGDLNGDGILDIAVANHNTNDVSILIGNGDGTFKAPVDYPVGTDPRHVLIYDFNKDGKLDLATANGGESTVSILYGNGDGTFQPQVKYTANTSPRWLAVADYNNDGFLDIATSNYDAKNVSVLLGTGSSVAGQAFTTHKDYVVGPNPTGLVAGDFNSDGLPDIAVTVGGLPTAPNTIMGVLLNIPAALAPTTLTFGTQVLNTASAPQAITLNNSAPNALTITSIGFTGAAAADYSQTNTCGSILSGNSSCAINVTFTPQGINSRGATLTVADSAPGGSQTATVTGTGTAASLAPTSLTFASQNVGTTSAPQVVTLSNVSGTAMSITGIAITGTNSTDFAVSSTTCGSTLAGKSNCTISVTFTPTASGARSAAVTVSDNGGGTSQSAALSGTGVGTTTTLTVAPTALTYPAQVIATSSTPQIITVTNPSSTVVVTITSIAITGTNTKDFSETNNCGTSLAAGASCSISVTFKPTTINTRTAAVTITDSATNSPQTVTLSGIGTAVSLSPTSLTFAAQTVGTTSNPQTVTLTNVSTTGTVVISKVSFTGTNSTDFAQTNNCAGKVAPKGTCTFNVTFTPSATGTRTASLSLADSGGGSPQTVALSGTGQ